IWSQSKVHLVFSNQSKVSSLHDRSTSFEPSAITSQPSPKRRPIASTSVRPMKPVAPVTITFFIIGPTTSQPHDRLCRNCSDQTPCLPSSANGRRPCVSLQNHFREPNRPIEPKLSLMPYLLGGQMSAHNQARSAHDRCDSPFPMSSSPTSCQEERAAG